MNNHRTLGKVTRKSWQITSVRGASRATAMCMARGTLAEKQPIAMHVANTILMAYMVRTTTAKWKQKHYQAKVLPIQNCGGEPYCFSIIATNSSKSISPSPLASACFKISSMWPSTMSPTSPLFRTSANS